MKPRGQRIDLNTATMAELVRLPRVGESLAGEIVRARPYRSVRALRNVPGVGEKLFHVLRPLVQVGQHAEPEVGALPAIPAAADLGAADRVIKVHLQPGVAFRLRKESKEALGHAAVVQPAHANRSKYRAVTARPQQHPWNSPN